MNQQANIPLFLFIVLSFSMCVCEVGNGFGKDGIKESGNDTIRNDDDWQKTVLPPASADINRRIQKYRTTDVKIILKGPSGAPFKNKKNIKIELMSHSFLFGCNVLHWGEGDFARREKYRNYIVRLFNGATLPLYWNLYEGQKDKPLDSLIHQVVFWCRENRLRPKVHPLIWHQEMPPWVKLLSQADFEARLHKRVEDLVGGYAGLIDTWEVFNESLIAPTIPDNPLATWVKRVGSTEAVRQSIAWARSANPHAFLLVNDFNVSTAYDDQISSLINKGQGPDAMSIQAHFSERTFPDSIIWQYFERVKKLNIPIHVSELSIPSGALLDGNESGPIFHRSKTNSSAEGERYQAEGILHFYRIIFSHPSVEAVTYWELADPGNSTTGLLRGNLHPKPAYNVLMKLIHNEWSTSVSAQTDSLGGLTFHGFFGHYQMTVDGKIYEFDVKKEEKKAIIIRVE
jgi:GH35 family endo-1,4-beta-xylanase